MDIYSVWPPISYLFSLISLIVFELVNLEKKPTIWKISNIKWAVLYRTYHHYFECFPLLQFMSMISVNEHLTNNLTVIIMNLLLKLKSAHTQKKNLCPSDYKGEFWNEQVVFFWIFLVLFVCLYLFCFLLWYFS